MNLGESIRVAWGGLTSNKLRSILTMLGVIIGVAAVIALVAVGQGATSRVSSQLEGLGSNLIIITPNRANGGKLEFSDAAELIQRVPTISRAVPSISWSGTVKWENTKYDTTVEGVSEGFPSVRSFQVAQGRFFGEEEVQTRRRVAVLGQTVVTKLFGDNTSPLYKTVTIMGQPFVVIGVMEPKGSALGRDQDDVVYIPVTVAQRIFGIRQPGIIYVQAKSSDSAAAAVQHISAIYQSKFKRDDAVRVTSQDQLLSTVNSMTQTLTLMLAAIAGISLLVGGIGIMNIMLVSVSERTREIGIRKAIGARGRDILAQFLVESLILSVSGGLLGILLGIGGARSISRLAGWTTVISPGAILIAFAFSAAVGLFFGVYPAAKAARLDPIEALRYE